MSESERIQNDVESILREHFSEERVSKEWSIDLNRHNYSVYEPRVDIAVGPFATEEGDIRQPSRTEIEEREEIFRELVDKTNSNFRDFENDFDHWSAEEHLNVQKLHEINNNPRCFLSVEVEAHESGKYMLGNIVNAISLGKIGMLIPCSKKSQKAIFRSLEYLSYLEDVEKPSYSTQCLVITEEQFKSVF